MNGGISDFTVDCTGNRCVEKDFPMHSPKVDKIGGS